MADDRSPPGGTGKKEAPVSDLKVAEDRGRSSQSQRARPEEGATSNRASNPRRWFDREEVNFVRPRRVRELTREEPRAAAPSAAKKNPDSKVVSEAAVPPIGAA